MIDMSDAKLDEETARRYANLNERLNKVSSQLVSLRVDFSNSVVALNRRINEANDQIRLVWKKLNEKASR